MLGREEHSIVKAGYGVYDKKGNKSGIHHWGYDGDKNLCFVKRKNGELDYYEK